MGPVRYSTCGWRKAAACLLLGAAAALPVAQAVAQEKFPSRPIRVLVPWPPGGTVDIVARVIAPKMAEGLGQPMVIENRPGAGGMIATEQVARAPKDGYLLALASATHVVTPILPGASLNFDPLKDTEPVALIGKSANVLSVPAGSTVTNVRELIAYANSRGGRFSIGHAGNGTANHLTAEMFIRRAAIRAVLVPYKGGGPVITDLMGGQIDMGFNQVSTVLPHIRSGKLKAVGIASQKRSAALPGVETIGESGLGNFEAYDWYGFIAPSGTPREATARIAQETDRALADPGVRSRLLELGAELEGGGPQRFADFLRSESEKWGAVVKEAGVRSD